MEKLFIEKNLTEQLLGFILDEDNRKLMPLGNNYTVEEIIEKSNNDPNFDPNEKETDTFRGARIFKEDYDKLRYAGVDVDSLDEIQQIVLNHYGLDKDTPQDDEFGFLFTYQEEGKEVTPHRDANRKGKINVRFNLLLKKPPEGGLPIIKGKVLEVEENEVYMILAGLHKHGTTTITKEGQRVLLSIGCFVDEDIVKEKGWMHPDCKAIEENPMWNRQSNYDEDKFYPYANQQERSLMKNTTLEDIITDEEYFELIDILWNEGGKHTQEEIQEVRYKLGFDHPSVNEENEEHIS
tara:strand:- start:782 stop:1663 length:882 start_codon:yes stop_codon:yes gene_type:complete